MFDHVVIGVADLARAVRGLSQIGLDASSGGEHPGRGTANALVPLARGYLELLTVVDAHAARAHSPNRRYVADLLESHPVVPLGYAFAVDTVGSATGLLERLGLLSTPPVPMRRRRPDGVGLTWTNVYAAGAQWRTPYPFLIAWDQPIAARWEGPHPGSRSGMPAVTRIELAGSPAVGARELVAEVSDPLSGDPPVVWVENSPPQERGDGGIARVYLDASPRGGTSVQVELALLLQAAAR